MNTTQQQRYTLKRCHMNTRQQQRHKSPAVTLTQHVNEHKVRKLHQRHSLQERILSPVVWITYLPFQARSMTQVCAAWDTTNSVLFADSALTLQASFCFTCLVSCCRWFRSLLLCSVNSTEAFIHSLSLFHLPGESYSRWFLFLLLCSVCSAVFVVLGLLCSVCWFCKSAVGLIMFHMSGESYCVL